MERENTSATNVFVLACFLSPLQPARHTEAAFILSEKHKALSEIRAKVWLRPSNLGLGLEKGALADLCNHKLGDT